MAVFDTLSARVVADIESGTLAPGALLSQRKFGKLYGVGRGVARRVLKTLLTNGYIEFAGDDLGGDYVVSSYTEAMRKQAIELRTMLEIYVIKNVRKNVSVPLIYRLKQINWDIYCLVNRGNLIRAVTMNRHFHLYLMEAVNKGPLEPLFDGLYREASSDNHESYTSLEEAFLAVCEHAVIIDALEMGDKKRVIGLVKKHVRKGFLPERQAGLTKELHQRRTGYGDTGFI